MKSRRETGRQGCRRSRVSWLSAERARGFIGRLRVSLRFRLRSESGVNQIALAIPLCRTEILAASIHGDAIKCFGGSWEIIDVDHRHVVACAGNVVLDNRPVRQVGRGV